MAIATTNTKLCLSTFADYMGIHPLAFNSISLSACIEGPQPCEAWMQYGWQNTSFISRELLAKYIHEAELQIEHYLQMFVAPTWTSEVHEWPNFYRLEEGKNFDATFTSNWKNIHQFGQPKKELIATVNVTLFDRDGDGFEEIVQIDYLTATPDDFDLCKLYLVYPNKNGDRAWEVCTHSAEKLSDRLRWETYTWNVVDEQYINTSFNRFKYIDGCTNLFYQNVLELWQESKDICKPEVEMLWRNPDTCARYNCTEYVVPACAISMNKCGGYFTVGPTQFDESCEITIPAIPCEPPDFIKVYYQSGCGNCAGVCDNLIIPIIKLAASKLPLQLCNCDCFIKELQRLQIDTSITIPNGERFNYPFDVRSNPFGTTIGAIEAYLYLLNIQDTLC